MTLWIDDGSDDGLLANCGSCVFAVEEATQGLLVCAWDPPIAVPMATTVENPMHEFGWAQPLVEPDGHCHHHPEVQKVKDFGRGWQRGLRRPEDRKTG